MRDFSDKSNAAVLILAQPGSRPTGLEGSGSRGCPKEGSLVNIFRPSLLATGLDPVAGAVSGVGTVD